MNFFMYFLLIYIICIVFNNIIFYIWWKEDITYGDTLYDMYIHYNYDGFNMILLYIPIVNIFIALIIIIFQFSEIIKHIAQSIKIR